MVKLIPKPFWCPVIFVVVLVFGAESKSAYDFIVVGSGAGGGAVARRLAESGKFNVLVLEAGGLPRPGHDIPALAPRFLGDPGVTFNYQSIPQPNAALYTDGIVSVVAGRMLGGTTSLNYMWYNRGHPRDWDNWAMLTGDYSWKYANMLKYFKRAETYKGHFPSDQHGFSGPVTVSRPRYAPGLDYWFAAAEELGYSIGDPNGPQTMGFHPVEFAKRNGRRASSFLAYLTPILNFPNLRIMTNTTATEIIFKGNKAVGVRFTSSSAHSQATFNNIAYATKEVIVCAGTYGSALLLQRSGIGPKAVLAAARIPILKELPVGLNFHDHAAINLNFLINNASVVMDEDRDLNQLTLDFFNAYGDGPFSSTRGATGQAMLSSSVSKAEGNFDWPDIQLCMSHSTEPYLAGGGALHNTVQVTNGETQMSSSIFLGRPRSRGSIAINATDPVFGNPVLDMGYLRDFRDMQMFLDGIVNTLRIYEHTRAYQSLAARYAPVDLPDCVRYPVRSKEYWICYIQQTVAGGCHPAGTNKMGRTTDPSAVVNSALKVIGVEGLRVADASIMPDITNANPHAAVYGIAEKAADMILNEWGSSVGNGQGGRFQVNNLFEEDGGGVQPLGGSLKKPEIPVFQQEPKFKQQRPQVYHRPQFQQQSKFKEQPQFQQEPLNQHHPQSEQGQENQKKPESHLTIVDKLNMLRNIMSFISKSSKSSQSHYNEHFQETFFFR